MQIVKKLLALVLSVLPRSPFVDFFDKFEALPYLGYLNYFIPVGTLLKIGAAWLVAIGIFYLWSIILRWIRAID